jgi:uncharacterized cysteine cluster protein YcgN (CxxCxxCC family)
MAKGDQPARGSVHPRQRPVKAAKAEPEPFWRRKTLEEMTRAEWESLCDGCGKCCLHKLEFVDTGELAFTRVACKMLDLKSCQCSDYKHRRDHVPDCVRLTPHKVRTVDWLPSTCAYRLVAEGKDLAWWHPLVSGDPNTVHEAGISVRGRAIRETQRTRLERNIIKWID